MSIQFCSLTKTRWRCYPPRDCTKLWLLCINSLSGPPPTEIANIKSINGISWCCCFFKWGAMRSSSIVTILSNSDYSHVRSRSWAADGCNAPLNFAGLGRKKQQTGDKCRYMYAIKRKTYCALHFIPQYVAVFCDATKKRLFVISPEAHWSAVRLELRLSRKIKTHYFFFSSIRCTFKTTLFLFLYNDLLSSQASAHYIGLYHLDQALS